MTGASPARGDDYLGRAERYAGRKFSRRDDLHRILRAARDPGGEKVFDEVLFLAKFCDRAIGIIRRTGPGTDEVAKLTAELASSTERLATLLGTLLGTPGEAGGGEPANAPRDNESFARLRILIGELAVLKNFELHLEDR